MRRTLAALTAALSLLSGCGLTDAIDIHAPEAGKGAGAQIIYHWLSRVSDMKHDHFVCFGDSPGDYDMARFLAKQSHDTVFVFSGLKFEGAASDPDITLDFLCSTPAYHLHLCLMKLPLPHNKALIAGAILLLAAFGVAGWYLYDRQAQTSAPEYFSGYSDLSGVPSRTDVPTSEPGVLVAWQDQSVVDGNLSCTLYQADTRQILATYYLTSGFNPKGKVSSDTVYKTKTLSRTAIDNLIKESCGQK